MNKPRPSGSAPTTHAVALQIGVIEPVGGHGGMDFYNHRLCESVTDAGCIVSLFTSSGYSSGRQSYRTMEYFANVFGRESKWRRAVRFVVATLRTFALIRTQNIKLVHYHVFHVGVLQYASVLLARVLGVKVIATAHDVGSFGSGENVRLLRKVYGHCTAVIAHSTRAKDTLTLDVGIDAKNVHHIPHGNYAGLLPIFPGKAEARAKLGLSPEDVVVLFFGQSKKVKRLDLLIEAMARAHERKSSRLKLLIAGTLYDTDGEKLAKQLQDRLPNAAIHHARYISNEEMPIYFAAADIAALPYDKIFQSGVVLLAMTYGVPVLTSDIEGMVEVVKNERTGLTFRAGDLNHLTERLIEIELGKWPLANYARAAQSFVYGQHDWSKCGQMTAAVYRKALGQ